MAIGYAEKQDIMDSFRELWASKKAKSVQNLSIIKVAQDCKDVENFSFRGEVDFEGINLLMVDPEKLREIVGEHNIVASRPIYRLLEAGAAVRIEDEETPGSSTVLVQIVQVLEKESSHLVGEHSRVPLSVLTESTINPTDWVNLGKIHLIKDESDIFDAIKYGLKICIPISKNKEEGLIEVISYVSSSKEGVQVKREYVRPTKMRQLGDSIKHILGSTSLLIDSERLSKLFALPKGAIVTGLKIQEPDEENIEEPLKVISVPTGVVLSYEEFLTLKIGTIQPIFNHAPSDTERNIQSHRIHDATYFNETLTLSERVFGERSSTTSGDARIIDSRESREIQEILISNGLPLSWT
mgnify:CR=1 FL=1